MVWECACGEGHISKVLESHGYDVVSTDLVYRGYGRLNPCDFLLENVVDFTPDDLKRFIIASFEIRSDNSSVRSIADDAEFIQRAVRTRSVRLKERMEHYGV